MPGAAPLTVRLEDLRVDVSLSGVAQGDLLVRGASKWNNLAAGTSGYFLKSNGPGANPSWAAVSVSPGGSSGQLQYNNAGAFGGLASTVVATSGNLITVTAPAATDVPLTITGHASQTVNLLTLKKSTTTVGYFGANGELFINPPVAPASGYSLRLQYLSTDKFTVDYAGNTSIQGAVSAIAAGAGYSTFVLLNAGNHLSSSSTYTFGVNSPAAQTGAHVRLMRSSTTSTGRPICDLFSEWVDSTDATRTGRLRCVTYYTSTAQEFLRVDASSDQSRIAVGGSIVSGKRLSVYSGVVTDVGMAVVLTNGQIADALQVLAYDGVTVLYKINKDGNPTVKSTVFFEDANGYISRTAAGNTMEFAPSGAAASAKLSANYFSVLTSNGIRLKADTDSADGEISVANKGGNSGTGLGLLLHGGNGSTSGTPTAGGYVKVYGGDGAAGNTNGGAAYVFGGAKFGSGLNGDTILGYTGSAARGNISLFGAGSFGSGDNVVFIANTTTVPTSDPTGGGILYVESGSLKYRGSSGTITTLGAA